LAHPITQTEPRVAQETIEPAHGAQLMQLADKNMSGTLVVVANDKQFGEESYELRSTDDHGLRLTSRGTFSFKVLFAAVKAVFSQSVSLGRDLRPAGYKLDIDGPLGIGSLHVQGTIVGDVVCVALGDKRKEIQIESAEPLVLGTFSTYAFIPLLMRSRENEGALEFQMIPLLGGEDESGDAADDRAILLRVERSGSLMIGTGAGEIVADRYVLTSDIGDSVLLARDDEFLALVATSDKGSLIAYRSDFFPHGIGLPR